MAYQFIREPLRNEEVDKLCHACEKTTEEKLLVWILLNTGLRVSELCSLTPLSISFGRKSLFVFLARVALMVRKPKREVSPYLVEFKLY